MKEIEYFLNDKITPEELFYTKKIIESMSYSTVKKKKDFLILENMNWLIIL